MKLALLLASLVLGAQAFGSGFEKSIPFGGEASGVAGIGTSYMQGSQALYYNPAGLVSDKQGAQDVSLNLSPTQASWKGPILNSSAQDSSNNKMLYPFSLMYGNTLNDKFGIGAGVYVSGGTYSDYQNADNSGLEFKTDLSIMEFAVGAGYKVSDNLKIGAAWRVVQVNANLDTSLGAGNYTQLSSLKDTNYTGFKLGAQYKCDDKNSFGLSYRSETDFKAKGTAAGTNGGTPFSTDVTVGTVFPQAVTLGANHIYNENWKTFAEYVWTQYSKVTNLAVSGSNGFSTPVQLQWKDQHNIRLAGEYDGWGMPVRFGYIWTSQVTNTDHAYATIVPPGPANTITLGTGYTFGSFKTDAGFEYTWASGTASGMSAQDQVTEYALHLGAVYSF